MATQTAPPPAKAKAPKAPAPRKCCATMTGKDSPHTPDCNNNPAKVKANTKAKEEKKAKNLEKQAEMKSAGRLPDGAEFTGTYSNDSWSIKLTATVNGETQVFSRAGSNHDKLFHQLAGECRAWAKKKQGVAPVPQADQQAECAAAETREEEKLGTIQALMELGMPDLVRPIAEKDQSLALAALSHFRFRLFGRAARSIGSKTGYIVACFRDPGKYGFKRDGAGVWHPPNGQSVRTTEDRTEKIRAQQQALREQSERIAKERALDRAREQRFDAAPDSAKEKVRSMIRKRWPLYADKDDSSPMFKGECIKLFEQLQDEGKL